MRVQLASILGQRGRQGRAALAILSLLLGLAVPCRQAWGAPFDQSFTFQSENLTVGNLIGEVRLRGVDGDAFHVTVKVQGKDASQDLIRFEPRQGHNAELVVRFPVEKHRRYVYPRLGEGSRSSFMMRRNERHGSDDWFGKLLELAGGDHIEVRGRDFGRSIEVWADVQIDVPRDRLAIVHLGMGSIDARDLSGELRLDTRSGGVEVTGVQGSVRIDTGSGGVAASHIQGDLEIDTGSGGVEIDDVRKAKFVKLDTGSGRVRADGVDARTLRIDTGSGGVELSGIEAQDLSIDTGSGGVSGERIGTDGLKVDTGSGGIDLDLVRMGRGNFSVETGSGGIRMHVPHELSADFDLDTGSGGLEAEIEGVTLDRRRKHEAHFTVGGGDSRVKLSTGSGTVRVVQSR